MAVVAVVVQPAVLFAQDTGVAEGIVRNGTTNAPAEGLPVMVQVYSKMTLLAEHQAVTDGSGRFAVAGLPAGPDNRYIVSLTYAGVKYGPPQAINPNEAQHPVVVTVYETTSSAEALSVLTASIAVTSVDAASGLIQVLEVVTLANRGDRAYVGDLLSDPEKGAVLRLPLPGPALDLELGDGFMEMPLATPLEMRTKTPAFPGETVFVYAYKLPYEGRTYQMRRAFEYPVERAALIVSASGPAAMSQDLTTRETVSIDDKAHVSLSRRGVPAGQEVAVTLSGLPIPAAPGQAGPALDTALRGVAIGMAALALAVVALYVLVRRRPAAVPTAAGPWAPERAALIKAIASLDDGLERGSISRERHAAERARLKERLTDVALLMQDASR
jgi:hypothetical protein